MLITFNYILEVLTVVLRKWMLEQTNKMVGVAGSQPNLKKTLRKISENLEWG